MLAKLPFESATQHKTETLFAFLFAASAALAIVWCASMPAMPEMPMPGGWRMSMLWMRMPGQTWIGATASFLPMWVVMMVAMMLPSLTPMLSRYRRAVGPAGVTRLVSLTALVSIGYFFVWTLVGLIVFPVGAAAAAMEMAWPALARTVPIAAGSVVLIAGALQFTKWKAHHLTCCQEAPGRGGMVPLPHAIAAWKLGWHFGLHCSLSCANLTAILLVFGVMDLRPMLVVMTAISAERLAPARECVVRAIGFAAVGAGLLLIVRVVALGRGSFQ